MSRGIKPCPKCGFVDNPANLIQEFKDGRPTIRAGICEFCGVPAETCEHHGTPANAPVQKPVMTDKEKIALKMASVKEDIAKQSANETPEETKKRIEDEKAKLESGVTITSPQDKIPGMPAKKTESEMPEGMKVEKVEESEEKPGTVSEDEKKSDEEPDVVMPKNE